MIVVDASAIVEFLLRMPFGDSVERRLRQSRGLIFAPQVIDLEIAHSLRRFALSRTLTAARASEAFEDLNALPLRRFGHTFLMERIWALRENLTAYDASYISLAELLGAPLITRDRKLAEAPGHFAAVEVV